MQKRMKLGMKFRINPPEVNDGILMYAAQSDDGQGDFASLAVKDKHLEFRFDTGSGNMSRNRNRKWTKRPKPEMGRQLKLSNRKRKIKTFNSLTSGFQLFIHFRK